MMATAQFATSQNELVFSGLEGIPCVFTAVFLCMVSKWQVIFGIPPAIEPVAPLQVAERFCHKRYTVKASLCKSKACIKAVLQCICDRSIGRHAAFESPSM